MNILIYALAGAISGFLADFLVNKLLRYTIKNKRQTITCVVCTSVLFAVSAFVNDDLFAYPLIFILVAVCAADVRQQIIPDSLVVSGIILALARLFFTGDPLNALIGAAVGALPLLVIDRLTILLVKKDGFGFGDVKLMFMCGLFLGGYLTALSLVLAFISGGLVMGVLLGMKKIKRGSYVAFGPFLAAGVLFAFFFGNTVINWYSDLLFL